MPIRTISTRSTLPKRRPLCVLRGIAGYYIGTANDEGPLSRESVEYFPTRDLAERALVYGCWTQRCVL